MQNRILLSCALTLALGAPAGAQVPDSVRYAMRFVSTDSLRTRLFRLAGDGFEGRGAGYTGDDSTRRYISGEFRRYGLRAPISNYAQCFSFHPRRPTTPFQTLRTCNIVGLLPGSDPALRDEIVVVGAHHDGMGMSGQANMGRRANDAFESDDNIWNSANDNASAVSVLLETARILVRAKTPLRRSILFITFGAEEHGLIGSLHYTSHPLLAWDRHVGMINLEMLGRRTGQPLSVTATSTSPAWASIIASTQLATGMMANTSTTRITNDSDHYGFAVQGVPAVQFSSGVRADYHEVTDEPERIDYNWLADITRYTIAFVSTLANLNERPRYSGTPGRDPGITGTVLTAEEARDLGLGPTTGAIKVTGTAPGLTAHAAGVRPGDIIVALDDAALPYAAGLRTIVERAFTEAEITLTVWRNRDVIRTILTPSYGASSSNRAPQHQPK